MSGLWTPLRSVLRMAVSGDKQRFDDGRVNLDLSFITDRIIGLPNLSPIPKEKACKTHTHTHTRMDSNGVSRGRGGGGVPQLD